MIEDEKSPFRMPNFPTPKFREALLQKFLIHLINKPELNKLHNLFEIQLEKVGKYVKSAYN